MEWWRCAAPNGKSSMIEALDRSSIRTADEEGSQAGQPTNATSAWRSLPKSAAALIVLSTASVSQAGARFELTVLAPRRSADRREAHERVRTMLPKRSTPNCACPWVLQAASTRPRGSVWQYARVRARFAAGDRRAAGHRVAAHRADRGRVCALLHPAPHRRMVRGLLAGGRRAAVATGGGKAEVADDGSSHRARAG